MSSDETRPCFALLSCRLSCSGQRLIELAGIAQAMAGSNEWPADIYRQMGRNALMEAAVALDLLDRLAEASRPPDGPLTATEWAELEAVARHVNGVRPS